MKILVKAARISALPCFFAAVAGIFVYAYFSRPFGSGAGCPIDAVFGVHCVTCGATRAAYLMLEGDLAGAFYYNALFTVGLVPAVVFTGLALVNFAVGKRVIPLPRPRLAYFFIVLAIVIAFAIGRNFTTAIY